MCSHIEDITLDAGGGSTKCNKFAPNKSRILMWRVFVTSDVIQKQLGQHRCGFGFYLVVGLSKS